MPIINIVTLVEPFGTVCGYLDPGTGSYALQLLLAGAFGGLFALKQSWQQCRAWWAQVMPRRSAPSTTWKGVD